MTDKEARDRIDKWYQEDCDSVYKLFSWIDQMTKLPQFKHITPRILQNIIVDGLAKY